MQIDMRTEIWKPIDGYGGRYQVNPFGEVRRVCKHKIVRLTAFNRRGGWFVKLSQNYRGKDHKVSHLVAAAFLPPKQPGQVLWHKNGVLSDNFAGNLQWISKRELGKRTALLADKRRVVAKVTRGGETIEFYPSARAAAKANHMSYQTVLDRCNGRVKKPFALDGYNYVFDEDTAI
jgi:hypothetical protein